MNKTAAGDSQASPFLPTTPDEMRRLGWESVDVVLFSGDAYVDHPSFGAAVVARVLEAEGLHVAVVPQPNWQDDQRDFRKFGAPKMFFAIAPGAMDSTVANYTAALRRRSDDAYSAGGQAGRRPDMPSIVYSKILRQLFPEVPIVLGGIEASLRRTTHYDYLTDRLRPTLLVDAPADILIYGMGERPLRELVSLLRKGVPFSSLRTVPQTAFLLPPGEEAPKNKHWTTLELSPHEECLRRAEAYAGNFRMVETESNRWQASRLTQRVGDRLLVINPQYPPMTTAELDAVYELPFTYQPHPRYRGRGAIPAYEMIRNSICVHRGCFGGCSFCTISAHQGKFITSRSAESVLREVRKVAALPGFHGVLSDVGGPSANMYGLGGRDLTLCQKCSRPSCLHPKPCKNLNTDLSRLTALYQAIDAVPGIRKSFVGSGIRYDLLLGTHWSESEEHSHREYCRELITRHVSGRLKVAPEHTDPTVLNLMRKPSFELFREFKRLFDKLNAEAGLRQQIVPYFISSHPGSTSEAMAELAVETKALNFELEQVQDFTPTPLTLSTTIYACGLHPYTLKPVYVAQSIEAKRAQRSWFFWWKREEQPGLRRQLAAMGRKDLADKLLSTREKGDRNQEHRHR